jgi:hypothetical protein
MEMILAAVALVLLAAIGTRYLRRRRAGPVDYNHGETVERARRLAEMERHREATRPPTHWNSGSGYQ